MTHWYGTLAGMTGWGYLFMVIGIVVPWLVIIGGGVWLARFLRNDRPHGGSAEQVLAGRYARGELDEDEYRHQLTVLRAGAPTGNRG
jgi:putative membrane protein